MIKTLFSRTVPSAGLVHFGYGSYSYAGDGSDLALPFEMTATRAREIAGYLLDAANYADKLGAAYPALTPLDETAPSLTDADAPDERFTHATDPDDFEFDPDPFDVGYDLGWDDGNQVGYADGRSDEFESEPRR